MREFKFRSCDIERVSADCFGGVLKSFKIVVKKGDDYSVGTPRYEIVQMDPKKVETAILLYLHKHSHHLAKTKPKGQILWLGA